jgi:hypothetical protein
MDAGSSDGVTLFGICSIDGIPFPSRVNETGLGQSGCRHPFQSETPVPYRLPIRAYFAARLLLHSLWHRPGALS